jgi:hypothetical protein
LKPDREKHFLFLELEETGVGYLNLESGPLCDLHRRLDNKELLECEIGNHCVACSLNERTALLSILAPFAPEDQSKDSVTVAQELADFYATHHGDGRVVVSYPAGSKSE